MKKKYLKLAAFALALAIIAGLCLFANALVGNPVSKALATRTAKRHLAENYPTYVLDRVGYSFKDGNYYAHLTDPDQIDGDFSLSITPAGKLRWDSYEDRVLSGENTRSRLTQEYRDLVDAALEGPASPLPVDFGGGDLECWSRESLELEFANAPDYAPDYALITEELEVNGTYDVRELGALAGHLDYYLEEETPSLEGLAHWLLEIRRLMDEAQVPFVDIDLSIRYLRDEEGSRPDSDVYVLRFPYKEIYEEGLLQRVEQANARAIAYYAELDKLK